MGRRRLQCLQGIERLSRGIGNRGKSTTAVRPGSCGWRNSYYLIEGLKKAARWISLTWVRNFLSLPGQGNCDLALLMR